MAMPAEPVAPRPEIRVDRAPLRFDGPSVDMPRDQSRRDESLRVDASLFGGPLANPPRVEQPGVPAAASPPESGARVEPDFDLGPANVSSDDVGAASVPSVEIRASGPVPHAYFPDLGDFGDPGDPSPVAMGDPAIGDVSAAGGPNVSSERRRPFAALFIVATLLAAVGIGAWWGISTGLFKTPAEIDTGVPNPPVTTDEEDFIPEDVNNAPQLPGEADAARNWVSVFTPADPTVVNAPGDTSADVMEDDTGAFIRVRSGASGSSVVFDVGQGILEQISGKHAVFDIIARSEEGKETQFAVDCNFGELGDCGRKRYAAGYAKGDFLFEIELPAKQPGSSGTIAVNSDITNGGKAIDIYEIRVSTAQ